MKDTEISCWLNDEMEKSDKAQFEELVKRDSSLQETLFDQLQIHEALQAVNADSTKLHQNICKGVKAYKRQASIIAKAAKNRQQSRKKKVYLCAALLIIGLILSVFPFSQQSQQVVAGQHRKITLGENQVTIVGPARYTIDKQDKISLFEGSILAEVNNGHFEVTTTHGTFRDLGTIFELHCTNQSTDLQVIEGRVEIIKDDFASQVLSSGEAASVSKSGVSSINYNSNLFQQYSTKEVVSVNFSSGINVNGSTGCVCVGHWNNITTSGDKLVNHHGEQTAVRLNFSQGIMYNQSFLIEGSRQIDKLYSGHLAGGVLEIDSQALSKLTITVDEIPYKKYDIYVYYLLAGQAKNILFDLSVNHGRPVRIHRSLYPLKDFERWSSPARKDTGNYQLFQGLTGAQAVITATVPAPKPEQLRQWHIAGFQIVERND